MKYRLETNYHATDLKIIAVYLRSLANASESWHDCPDDIMLGEDSDNVAPGQTMLEGDHGIRYSTELEEL